MDGSDGASASAFDRALVAALLALLVTMTFGAALLALRVAMPRRGAHGMMSLVAGALTAGVELARGARWDLRDESPTFVIIFALTGAVLAHRFAPPLARRRRGGPRSALDASLLVLAGFAIPAVILELDFGALLRVRGDLGIAGRLQLLPLNTFTHLLFGAVLAAGWGGGLRLVIGAQPGKIPAAWVCVASGALICAGFTAWPIVFTRAGRPEFDWLFSVVPVPLDVVTGLLQAQSRARA